MDSSLDSEYYSCINDSFNTTVYNSASLSLSVIAKNEGQS